MRNYAVSKCPICNSGRSNYARTVGGWRVICCNDCNFLYSSPQPSDEALSEIYGAAYFCGAGDSQFAAQVAQIKSATGKRYLKCLRQYGVSTGALLEVGCGDGYQLAEAEKAGFAVTGIEYSRFAAENAQKRLQRGKVLVGEIESVDLPEESFDVCIIADVIEHVRDPRAFLQNLWARLKPGGCLLVATPTMDSWSARLMGSRWMEFKAEHLLYFTRKSLESLLWQTGFGNVHFEAGVKCVSFSYVNEHFTRYPAGVWSSLVRFSHGLLPTKLRERPIEIAASGMIAICSKAPTRPRPLVSIIIPVFNEVSTVKELLTTVAAKKIKGADKEIVVVESNSTDGSRKIVEEFREFSEFKIILEDRPRGKGAAMQVGLAEASGDIVLIQDADLEYDLEDYDSLIEPLLSGRESFVLGARHGGAFWKMRQFEGQYGVSLIMNMAHFLFTAMINLSFGTRLRDPFTMYKVFRRDAISGLKFRCKRFDFDWELLILLVRKGFRPIEIPVNYRSRSYKEGKKVRFFLDPLTWMWTLLRLRFSKTPYRQRKFAVHSKVDGAAVSIQASAVK